MGYGEQQLHDLETTINNTNCDTVIIATPIDLNRIIKINKPTTHVFYDLQEIGKPDLTDILEEFLKRKKIL
jgi:predicted GTPase